MKFLKVKNENGGDGVKFTYRLSEEDHVKYALYNFKRANAEKEVLAQMRPGECMLMTPMFIATLEAFRMSSKALVWVCLAVWAFLFVAILFYYPKLIEKAIEKQAIKSAKEAVKSDPSKEESELEMNEKGISCSNDVSEFFNKWASVKRISFDSRYVYLITNSVAFTIPVYKTECSIQEVLDYIKTFVPNEDLYVKM